MIKVRPSNQRGRGDHGWLKSQHTFSFADYYDPSHMSFKSLRVINEDYIQGGNGFGTHPHQDMEIITYIVAGALEHKDSMGTTAVIKPGEVQKMSAGTGVAHSEYNKLQDQETHLLQIWIMPNKKSVTPSYGQKSFEEALKQKDLVLAVSQDGREGSIAIHQDADLYISRIKAGRSVEYKLRPQRGAWLQVVKGSLNINDTMIKSGDGVSVLDEPLLKILADTDSEFMLFDLA